MAKILLADDSVTIQKVVEVILSKEGHELKVVNAGEEALSALSTFNPDVILADVVMPGINGYQLAEEVRKKPGTKEVPIILLAGAFEPIDQELADKSGANGTLIKPFESEDLLNKINSMLLAGVVAAEESEAMEEAAEFEEAEAMEVSAVGEETLEVEEEGLLDLEELYEEPIAAAKAPMEAPVEVAPPEVEEETHSAEAVKEPPETPVLEEIPLPPAGEPSEDLQGAVDSRVAGIMDGIDLSDMLRTAVDEKLTELINNTDLTELLKGSIEEKLSETLRPGAINEVIIDVLKSGVKAILEQSLEKMVPELTENLLKSQLEEAMASAGKVIESVVWETVPELSEAIIKKEIGKIRSES
jgi:CheY-like chemotaxis protein